MKLLLIVLLSFLTTLALSSLGLAAPQVIHYQAQLSDTEGMPLQDPVDLTFRVYTEATGGSLIWEEAHSAVPLTEGRVSVLLGSLVSFPVTLTQASGRWLEVQVNDDTLAPRMQFASVPFALEADRLDGKDASAFEVEGAAAALQTSLVTSDETPPNEGGWVHWNNLLGVPEGFADGVDNGLDEALAHGSLTGLEADDHPQYLLKSQVAAGDGDPPNQGSNLVHWENLVGVPEGFADGEDAAIVGEGITSADIRDSTIAEIDVVPGSLTGQSIAPGSLDGTHVQSESLTGTHILDDSIWSADILDKSITGSDIKDDAIDTQHLADESVGSAQIQTNSIDTSHVAFDVGDITEVIAGQGLSGGGDGGSVTLNIGEGGGIDVTGNTVALAPSYFFGTVYDNRFVKRDNPSFNSYPGVVSVSGAAFRPASNGAFTVHEEGYFYVDLAGTEDRFTAPIQLPHGGTITDMWTTYWDNSSGAMDFRLMRKNQDGSGSAVNVAGGISAGETAAWVTVQDNTISNATIDNISYVYWLEIDFPFTSQGDDLRLQSIRIHYTITAPY